jgi:hypothetical protein
MFMKKCKRPTRKEAEIISGEGLDYRNWYVVKDTSTELEIISKAAVAKGSNKTRTIIK